MYKVTGHYTLSQILFSKDSRPNATQTTPEEDQYRWRKATWYIGPAPSVLQGLYMLEPLEPLN